MAKLKTVYFCQECGTQHIKWQGQCSGCKAWNTLVEEVVEASPKQQPTGKQSLNNRSEPKLIAEIDATSRPRLITPDNEFNRVLGGGITAGSVVLLGGEPGIGKSTLLLQLALQLSKYKILYVSGEESEQQIKMRAERIPFVNDNLYVAAETNIERIIEFYKQLKPDIIVIDSIQTVYTDHIESAPGSVSQVRESAARIIRIAKEHHIPIFIVGHITKEGMIAGPKVLEHIVDTVLTFEGDRHNSYRIVRTSKNRFGGTMEIGIYEMRANGLREVTNPSEIFLSNGGLDTFSGVAIASTLEGLRPLLIETQALVTPLTYGNPQRSATGFDLRRLSMLLAVMEKRCGFKLGTKDVFINLAGGLRIEDPALDLALVCSIVSSMHDLVIPPKTVFAAEVGLSGEIRPISRLEPRIAEAEKLGFKEIYVSSLQISDLSQKFDKIKITGVSKLQEAFQKVFGGQAE